MGKSWIWFYLWSRVKPLINQPRIEDEIAALKERSDKSVSACKEAEDKEEFLEKQHGELIENIAALKIEIEENSGNVAAFIENQALIAAQKAELEGQYTDAVARFEAEQEAKNELTLTKKQ